ncbi:MAG: glycosyltransferase family 39 protein [Anaerolineae bacterium]|nr:glycosyltransferase family 39 protein [Anaerolineae bacterium]
MTVQQEYIINIRQKFIQYRVMLIIALALVTNLFFLSLYYGGGEAKRLFGDEVYYYQSAVQLARGEEVAYNLLWPPLQIEWMGQLFRITGESILAAQIVQIILWLLTGLLVYSIAKHIKAVAPAAIYVLAIMLFSPELIAFSHFLWPETLHLFLFVLSLWALIAHPNQFLFVCLGGFAMGLALLTKSVLMPFLPVIFLAYILLCWRAIRWRVVYFAVLYAICMGLAISPVMIRNQQRYGSAIIADSSLFNIWVGLNDVERVDSLQDRAGTEFATFMASAPTHQERNAILREKITSFVQEHGVISILAHQLSIQYFRLFYHDSFFTSQLPHGARSAYPEMPLLLENAIRLYTYGFYLIVWVLMLYGLSAARWWPMDWRGLFALFLVYNLGLFLVLHIKTRFLIQLYPVVAIFAAVALHTLIQKMRGSDIEPPYWRFGRRQLAFGTGLSLLFLFFALHPGL